MNSGLNIDAPSMSVTYDREVISHMITDDQLTTLEDTGSGRHEFSLACAGAALGFSQNFYRAAHHTIWPSVVPADPWDGIAAVLFAVCTALAIAFFVVARQDRSATKKLAERIRNRPVGGQATSKPFNVFD